MPKRFLAGKVWADFARDRRANFAVMTALSMPLAITLAAFAVDEGSLYTERRASQSLVDIAAITAAANIDRAEAAVLTTLRDNGIASVAMRDPDTGTLPADATGDTPAVRIVRGHYSPDPAVAAGSRFQPLTQPYNAVRVTLERQGTLFFGSAIMAPPTISTTAVASSRAEAAFSVGSRLAKVDGGILNALLGGLVGGNLSLSVMDYDALIGADVDALSFLDALALQLHVTGGTYSEVLQSKATIGQVATALANTAGVGQASKLALQAIAAGATLGTQIPLSQLIDLGPVARLGLGQRPSGLPIDASAFGMLTAAATLANSSHQVQLDLGTTVPGLVSAKLAIAIGEPPQSSPWLAVGETGTVVRTAQTRLRLDATIGNSASNLGGGIKLLSVSLPLHVEVAQAEARLAAISCPTGRPDSISVSVAARPGIASLRLAESDAAGFADFSKPQSFHDARIAAVSLKLLLLSLDLLGVDGSASATSTNTSPTMLTFDSTDIANKAVKSTPTKNVTETLTLSLVNDLTLSVNALGLGLDVTGLLSTVKPAVVTVLKTVTVPLDTLLYNTLSALGVRIGEADVRVTGATCGRAVLVQ
nr:TadG family pilus assembly protein [Mesorhizobium sp.]